MSWESKKLKDISAINYGYTAKASYEVEGPKFLRITDIQDGDVDWDTVPSCPIDKDEFKKHQLQEGDIVFARTGATTGKSYRISNPVNAVAASYLIRLRIENDDVLPSYVSLFFQTAEYWDAVNAGTTGSAQGGFNASKLGDLSLPIPPLEKQKRIVAILGEAFERIEKAQANAEHNLANARELFKSYRENIFTQGQEGWIEKPLKEVCILQRGFDLPTHLRKAGNVPLVSSSGIIDYVDEKKVSGPGVATGRSGSIGNVFFIEEDFWPLNTVLYIKEFYDNDPEFVYNLLKRFDLSQYAHGAGVPTLNRNHVHGKLVEVPESKEKQQEIVKRLKAVYEYTENLALVYEQKLSDLSEMKKSLLQKAFSGELTSSNIVAFTPISQQQVMATTSPEFAAHMLAYGYHWHEAQRRNDTYGRVKGQKLLHMAESQSTVDMGRQPIKDAAGPNDFQHMLRAEEWAEAQQFFKFVPRRTGNGYDFKKLANYNSMIGNSLNAMKPYKDKLEKILALLMPMNSQQAEVLATVHAAWNNLLLDDTAITDDAIIYEARDNWHPSKMNIPETEFKKAIATIRRNGIIPDGKAKRVAGQERLL